MNLAEISHQLAEVYEGNPWFGNSISAYLQAIKPEMLSNRIPNGHSIGQIIAHMISWRRFAIYKLQNNPTKLKVGSEEDWTHREFTPEDKTRLYSEFKQTQKLLLELISAESDELLQQMVPEEEYDFKHLLVGVIQHDIYHLGQIYLLKSNTPT